MSEKQRQEQVKTDSKPEAPKGPPPNPEPPEIELVKNSEMDLEIRSKNEDK